MTPQEIHDAITARLEAKKQAAARRQAELRKTRAVLAQRRASGLVMRHSRRLGKRNK